MTTAAPLMEKIDDVKSLSISKCPKEPELQWLTRDEQHIKGAPMGFITAPSSPSLAMGCVPCQILGVTGEEEFPQGYSTVLLTVHALSHF